MAIITLLSDMGTSDHYVAAVKGAILRQLPGTMIVDISHNIAPFNNMQAAFVLRNAWHEFPTGTIHIIGVNPGTDSKTPHIAVRHKGHYFVGADNGIFSMLFDEPAEEVYGLTLKLDTDHRLFPVKHIFVKAACHLGRGGTIELLGRRLEQVQQQLMPRAVLMEEAIKGQVIHVDHYGNVITNITRQLFNSLVRNRPFVLTIGRSKHNIRTLHKHYSDVAPGEKLAFLGDSGYLEIAVNKGVKASGGGASQLLGLKVNDVIRLELEEVAQRTAAS